MNHVLIVGALGLAASLSPAFASAPEPEDPKAQQATGDATGPENAGEPLEADAEHTTPAYDVLYLADKHAMDAPQAVVSTGARTEEQWRAIGRDLRAQRQGFPAMVVFFVSEHAIPIPEGYPDCEMDQRRAFERWAMGTYIYQSRTFEFNDTGEPVETIKQNVATPRKRTLNGVDVIEMHEPDPTAIRNAPPVERIVGVSVVVPGLKDDDLTRVAQAYEAEFGTPRLLQIVFFTEEPDWADKPFMTQGFFNHAGRAYLRSSRAKDKALTEILPLVPRWVTLENGEMVEK